MTSETEALRMARDALEVFARADRAVGGAPGPFRFETGTGYRPIERESLRNATKALAAIDAALSAPDPKEDDEDTSTCESCGKRAPIEQSVYAGGVDICIACHNEWLKEYQACAHEWEPEPTQDHMGDPVRYCGKCGGTKPFEPTQPFSIDIPPIPQDASDYVEGIQSASVNVDRSTIIGGAAPTPAISDEAVKAAAKAAYKSVLANAWGDEDPNSLDSVWVDGDGAVDFLHLARAALTAALPLMTGDNQAPADVIRAKEEQP